jgi:glycogen operon protein
MLLQGDEIGRTQKGNNNAYCQDNDLSWTQWEKIGPADTELHDFVRYLVKLRRKHRVFSRTRFFRGEVVSEDGLKDITWVTCEGREMAQEDWDNGYAQCIGYVLNGAAGEFYTPGGQRDIDESFLVLLNAYHEDIEFTMPDLPVIMEWDLLVDTDLPSGIDRDNTRYRNGDSFTLKGRSLAVFVNSPERGGKRERVSPIGVVNPEEPPAVVPPVATDLLPELPEDGDAEGRDGPGERR